MKRTTKRGRKIASRRLETRNSTDQHPSRRWTISVTDARRRQEVLWATTSLVSTGVLEHYPLRLSSQKLRLQVELAVFEDFDWGERIDPYRPRADFPSCLDSLSNSRPKTSFNHSRALCVV